MGGGAYHYFPSKLFCLAEIFRRGTFLCFRKFPVSKNFMDKRGGGEKSITIFCLIFLFFVSRCQKIVGEPFGNSEKLGYRNILSIRAGGGWYYDSPSENYCLPVLKNFVGEPFWVPEKFWYREISKTRWEGAPITIFHRNSSVSQKYFVEEPFFVSESFRYRKILWIRGGGGREKSITIFCLIFLFFVSRCQKIVGEPFGNSEKLGYRNILSIRAGGGWYYDSPSENYCLPVLKNFVGEPFLVSRKFWYRNFSCIRGGRREGRITIMRRKFVSQYRWNFVGEPFLVAEKFWYRNFSCMRGGGGKRPVSRLFVESLSHRTNKSRRS